MNTILSLGIVLVGGLAAEKVVSRYNVPAITSYILLGILLGPHVFHLTGDELLGASELLSNIVLGFIAFNIGENFSAKSFRRIGKSVLVISLLAAIIPWLLVTLGTYTLGKQPLYVALLYGAIAAATAPTATMMVIRQYRAKGYFTDLLLGVVAIDDAWGIMAFSISLAVAENLQINGFAEVALTGVAIKAMVEILLSIVMGASFALVLYRLSRRIRERDDMLVFMLGAVLLNTGFAMSLHLSPLLANMALGACLVNIDAMSFRFFEPIKTVDWPLYILFYVLAGANLDVTLLASIGLVGIVYLFFRTAGKFSGAFFGALAAGDSSVVKNYMGLALMPQAGVAIGLAMIARAEFPAIGSTLFTTIAATTVILEILGPVATRHALAKAGDITS